MEVEVKVKGEVEKAGEAFLNNPLILGLSLFAFSNSLLLSYSLLSLRR